MDSLSESILEANDEDILEECRLNGIDIKAESERIRQFLLLCEEE